MPDPGEKESRDEWLDRCMGDDEMNRDFPDNDQRFAVCNEKWRNRSKNESLERAFKDVRFKQALHLEHQRRFGF